MDSHAPSQDVVDETTLAILPERGLVFSEIRKLQLQLCKPKLLPIKSYSLEKLEKMEKKLAQEAKAKRDMDRAQRQARTGWGSPGLIPGAGPRATSASSSPVTVAPDPPPKGISIPAEAGAVPVLGTPGASSLALPRQAVSPRTLSSSPVYTGDEACVDAPMSAPESSWRASSVVNISSCSSSSSSSLDPVGD
ncbi:hypothetical protein JKF63_06665 [Porcisia hertigi]|uniref:Uncharacterized protein n=1 Tax=Porcisia hertigi TaxID=2761500 RepID=A0A836IPC9_9TRYP|nr:hypothetical protein JKF63_06665 [Porcisia hertigi]